MCLAHRSMPRKARIFLAIGNFCLFTGFALNLLNHDFGAHHSGWYDFTRGLFLGLAITFNLATFRLSRRQPPQPMV